MFIADLESMSNNFAECYRDPLFVFKMSNALARHHPSWNGRYVAKGVA